MIYLGSQYMISLERKDLGLVLAKAFEYLMDYQTNLRVALKLVGLLQFVLCPSLHLESVQELLTRDAYMTFIIEDIFESIISKDSDLRIGQDPKNSFVTQFIATISKVKSLFASRFSDFYSILKRKRISILSEVFGNLVPINKLSKEHLLAVRNELELEIKVCQRVNSSLCVPILIGLAQNKHFVADEWFFSTALAMVQRLPVDASQDSKSVQKKKIRKAGALLSGLLMRKHASIQETEVALQHLVGFLDTTTDNFHPKSMTNLEKIYHTMLFCSFLQYYTSNAFYWKNNQQEKYALIRPALHPAIRKILNFAVFDRFSGDLQTKVMALCYLEKEDFLDFLLRKLQFGFENEQFPKRNLIELVERLTDIVPNDENYSQHLNWIIPRLLQELDKADQKSAMLIESALCSIFELFFRIEQQPGQAHLKPMKDDIDRAMLMLFDASLKRSETDLMSSGLICAVFSINDFIRQKAREKVASLIKSSFDSINLDTARDLLSKSLQVFPKETEQQLIAWLKAKCLSKAEQSRSTDTLLFGPVLRAFGVDSVEYVLGTANETTLKRYIHICQAPILNMAYNSEELNKLVLTFLSLALESEHESAVAKVVDAFKMVLQGFSGHVISYCSNIEAKDNKEVSNMWKRSFPDKDRQGEVLRIVSGLILQTIGIADRLMKEDLGSELAVEHELRVIEFFKLTTSEAPKESQPKEKDVSKKLVSVARIIFGWSEFSWIDCATSRSRKLAAVFSEFQGRFLDYCTRSGAYENSKLRELVVSFLYSLQRNKFSLIFPHRQLKQHIRSVRDIHQFFRYFDMSAKVSFAVLLLETYNQAESYFVPENYSDLDSLDYAAVLPHYQLHRAVDAKNRDPLWVFSQDTETSVFKKNHVNFLQASVLLSTTSPNLSPVSSVIGMHYSLWFLLPEEDLDRHLLQTAIELVSLDQPNQDKFSKTAILLDTAMAAFLKNYPIRSEKTIQSLFRYADLVAKKGLFALVQPYYFSVTNKILTWASLPADNPMTQELEADLRFLEASADTDTTLLHFVQIVVRLVINYKNWDHGFRARFVAMVISKLGSKDINKRIVAMALLVFCNRLLKTTDFREEKVIVDFKPFCDDSGFVSVEATELAFRAIRARLGLTAAPSAAFTAAQLQELDQVTPELFAASPKDGNRLFLPFEANKIKNSSETVQALRAHFSEAGRLQQIEDTLVDFLKHLVSEYSEAVDEKNLTVKYAYVEYYVDTKKAGPTFGKESLIFGSLRIAALAIGFDSVLRVFERLEREFEPKTSDYRRVVLILLSAVIGASLSFTDEEYKQTLQLVGRVLTPLMNSLSFKDAETYFLYKSISMKSAVCFRRTVQYYDHLEALMLQQAPEDRGYWLLTAFFEIGNLGGLVSDRIFRLIHQHVPNLDLSNLKNLSIASKLFGSSLFTRFEACFGLAFATRQEMRLSEAALSRPLYRFEQADLEGAFTAFIGQAKKLKVISRFEVVSYLARAFAFRKIDEQNLGLLQEVLLLLVSLDPNEDLSVSQMIQGIHKMLPNIFKYLYVSPEVLNPATAFIHQTLDGVASIDCTTSLLSLVRPFADKVISPQLNALIARLARDQRVNLRDPIDAVFRHSIFARLPNRVIYAFAQETCASIDKICSEKYAQVTQAEDQRQERRALQVAQQRPRRESHCPHRHRHRQAVADR